LIERLSFKGAMLLSRYYYCFKFSFLFSLTTPHSTQHCVQGLYSTGSNLHSRREQIL